MLFSPEDALYACKFAELLHNLGTPYFSTLQFFDRVRQSIND